MLVVKQTNPRSVNSVFNEFFHGFPSAWGRDYQQEFTVPAVNILESKDGYHVELNAAGLTKEDFKVSAENGLLTISYEKKETTETNDVKVLRTEFRQNSFKRTFSLDDKVNVEAIQAKYENGILKITLPKKEEVKVLPKEIAIL